MGSDRVDRLGSEAREYLNETCKDPRSLNPDRIIDQLRTALASALARAEKAEKALHDIEREAGMVGQNRIALMALAALRKQRNQR